MTEALKAKDRPDGAAGFQWDDPFLIDDQLKLDMLFHQYS